MNSDNIYTAILTNEKNSLLASKADGDFSSYLKDSPKIIALELLSKWTQHKDAKMTNTLTDYVFEDLATGNIITETIKGLDQNTSIEFGKTLADVLAKQGETTFKWSFKDRPQDSETSLTYKKDEFYYEATSKDENLKGTVKAYTLTEATKMVMSLMDKESLNPNEMFEVKVINPYMAKEHSL